jgi:hypothetical protein
MNNLILSLTAATAFALNVTAPEVPALSPVPVARPAVHLSAQDRADLYRTLLGEAAHQGKDEIMAITGVILNRLSTGRYGASLSAVVRAKACKTRTVQGIEGLTYEDCTYQFTAWDPWHYDSRAMQGRLTPLERKAMARLIPIADEAVAHWKPMRCRFVNYYHPGAMKGALVPAWARGRTFTQIGEARFLSVCDRKARTQTTRPALSRIASAR